MQLPCYSGVQYSRFYHVLETVATGKCGNVFGTGRYPPISERPRSSYSSKSQSFIAFSDLVQKLRKSEATVIVTFPSNDCSNGLSGILVEDICSKYFQISKHIVKSQFSTLGGNNTIRSARKGSNELILVMKPK